MLHFHELFEQKLRIRPEIDFLQLWELNLQILTQKFNFLSEITLKLLLHCWDLEFALRFALFLLLLHLLLFNLQFELSELLSGNVASLIRIQLQEPLRHLHLVFVFEVVDQLLYGQQAVFVGIYLVILVVLDLRLLCRFGSALKLGLQLFELFSRDVTSLLRV